MKYKVFITDVFMVCMTVWASFFQLGRACVCWLLTSQAGGWTVSCVCGLMLPNPLPLFNCYYSVRSCCVFLGKGSYFISSFCLWLNVSAALLAIFAHFNSLLHPNKNIRPLSQPITHVGPRKLATSSIGLISLTRFSTAVSPGFSGSLSWTFHQLPASWFTRNEGPEEISFGLRLECWHASRR